MQEHAARIKFSPSLEQATRRGVCEALEQQGVTQSADTGAQALILFARAADDAVGWIRGEQLSESVRVLVVTLDVEPGGSEQALGLVRAGAADVLAWDDAGTCAACIASRLARWDAIDGLLQAGSARALIGGSPAWRRTLRQVAEIAAFSDAPLLIQGETGTGKELVARLVHDLDGRSDKQSFIVLDCTTIVDELAGSEFFGHERGAFTGAVAPRNGAFALADGGTLFLDEVGELPLPLQAELLRVAQEQTYKRVGGSAWQTTHFRLICATNRDLEAERDAKRFRADLLYRIAGWTVRLPPLREREGDLLPLVRYFLEQHLVHTTELDAAVRDYLLRRPYPGNIRELRQLVARMAHRHVGPGPISIGDLGEEALALPAVDHGEWRDAAFRSWVARALAQGMGLKDIGRLAEDVAVKLAIQRENGSLQNAARRLGVTDRALQLRRASQRAPDPGAKSA